MGVALFAPPTEVLRRRLLAGALSIAANGALLLLLILLPHRFASTERPDAIDVVFVTLPPPQPVEAVEPDPEPVAQPEPDTPEPVAEEPVAETVEAIPPAPSTERAETPAPAEPGEQVEEDETPAGGGGAPQRPTEFIGDAMPLPRSAVGGPQGAVRDVFCLSSSDANRDALGCPPSDGSEGLYMLQFASPENIAKGEAAFANLSGAQIRALYTGRGLPVRDLDGQSTLADPTGRMTSSADQMRDSLPPLVPDPAFGD